MKIFYFGGGPKPGYTEEFFQRLAQIGGSPVGWQIYPHAAEDGKALHIVNTDAVQIILDHLQHFDGTYEHSDIIEIRTNA
ncbi:MAG TPA: hypothetical protein VK897_03005 [Anaerolineales bacterium]|nr:hypothetical protein [Anaerolineales bacterium]